MSDPQTMASMMAILGLVPQLAEARSPAAALDAMVLFAGAHPGVAASRNTPAALYSMAVDAFTDTNGSTARTFVRLAAFCVHFAAGELLEQLREGGSGPLADAFVRELSESASRLGLIRLLREKIAGRCACMSGGR